MRFRRMNGCEEGEGEKERPGAEREKERTEREIMRPNNQGGGAG